MNRHFDTQYPLWKQLKKFIQYFIHYEKTLFTTNLKDWNYINIIVACITILTGLFALVGILALAYETGFFWTITLLISVFLYRLANNSAGKIGHNFGLDDEDRMLLKAASGGFFLITLMMFLVFITT